LAWTDAAALLQPHTPAALDSLRYYSVVATRALGHEVLLARTGYTGEDGFELMPAAAEAVGLWEALLALQTPLSPVPCGLGALDDNLC
jgi:aminomethyltransferase